jgi:hypothetical protein
VGVWGIGGLADWRIGELEFEFMVAFV